MEELIKELRELAQKWSVYKRNAYSALVLDFAKDLDAIIVRHTPDKTFDNVVELAEDMGLPQSHREIQMNKKLIATDEAVGVSVPKSKLINEGPETFNEAWEIARTQIASTPGYNELEIRDIVFSDTGESLEMKFLLAKIQESET